jgi:hypothetical protein
MKLLGILCGVVGVWLLVHADEIDSVSMKEGSHPYTLWLWAGVFIVMGFVYFYRRWSEQDE